MELPLPAWVWGTAEALPLLVILHLNWKVGQGLPARGLDRHGVQGEAAARREASWALTHLCIYSPETLPRAPPGSLAQSGSERRRVRSAHASAPSSALRPGLAAGDGQQLLKLLRLRVVGFPLTGLRGRPPPKGGRSALGTRATWTKQTLPSRLRLRCRRPAPHTEQEWPHLAPGERGLATSGRALGRGADTGSGWQPQG